jgi:hypothetical protein
VVGGNVNTKNSCTMRATITLALLFIFGLAQLGLAQSGTNPLTIFKNYFVTGDYVVAGWVEQSSDGTYATGTITVPDPKQKPYLQSGVQTDVPQGADIVAAYLYWATVEGNQSSFVGQHAFFNGYAITGDILGNPNAPVSWSAGGCSGAANGSKTMRTYRADVRPYLPVDNGPQSPTYGAYLPNGQFQVRLADSGSNGNTQPNALGASLVIIYRVLNPSTTPLNAVVLYDGAYAPSNSAQTMSLTLGGFYEPSPSPTARITHIVANGQPNKGETVSFGKNNAVLTSLYTTIYGQNAPPFPGIYNGTWDNPTWSVGDFMTGGIPPSLFDTAETTTVVPASTNSGCVSWGAVIMSTTVQDSDSDGLLDVWETKDAQGRQGYTDAVSGNYVALPGADSSKKDIFVELDYLSNLDGSAGPYLHSHLPKKAALDAVGNAFYAQGINIHFDVGNVYQDTGDPYIISDPTSAGGNAVSEGAVLCTDGATLCEFPGQPAIGWKGGLISFQNDAALGNFQPGRSQSYHYILSGHSLGAPRSFWSAYGSALADADISQLISIVNAGNTATVTLQTPQSLSPQGVALIAKPGDCPNALIVGCSDANAGRVTIVGALGQSNLNGTYLFSNAHSSTTNNVTTTTFTITTTGVPDGIYNFGDEPQLGVAYLGPTSTSGHSDFGGGGDSAITLGLWRADDVSGCQPDPSQPLQGNVYCDDQVGTLQVQIGTLLHELGHSLSLTHGGTYYEDNSNPSLATYELNCKPNFVSVMNYLFQVRGFSDGGFDYSGQTMQPLNEAYPPLDESVGIGNDIFTNATSAHPTRWYSQPNALDTQIQNATGGRYAKSHCDGTPLTSADVPAVRVDGVVGTNSFPLDWNNDLFTPDAISAPGIDINYNGLIGDLPFSGFDDWTALNLQQIGARTSAFGFSGAGGLQTKSGGLQTKSGGVDNDGGGLQTKSGGLQTKSGGLQTKSGGIDQDETTATSTQTPPTGLTCTQPVTSGKTTYPGCVQGTTTPGWIITKAVPLTWNSPAFGQIRAYNVYRATNITGSVLPNAKQFSKVQTLTPIAPSVTPPTNWVDTTIKNNNTYTYFVTAVNKQGVQSGASNFVTVTITTK